MPTTAYTQNEAIAICEAMPAGGKDEPKNAYNMAGNKIVGAQNAGVLSSLMNWNLICASVVFIITTFIKWD